MVKKSFTHIPRLERYISSLGTKLPGNLGKFVRQSQCVFCYAEHDNLPVYIWGAEAQSKHFAEVFMCKACAMHVKELELKINADNSDLFAQNGRLGSFCNSASFSPLVHLHFDFLEAFFPSFPEEVEQCYFCQNPSDQHYILPVPIKGSNYIDGGHVRYCGVCRDLLLNTIAEGSLDLFYTNSGFKQEKCFSCKKLYYVGSAEHEYRSMLGVIGKMNCPYCSVKALNRHYANETLNRVYQFGAYSIPDEYAVERLKMEFCHYCEVAVDLDICMPPDLTEELHISHENKIMCENCSGGHKGPIYSYIQNQRCLQIFKSPHEAGYYSVVIRSLNNERVLHEFSSNYPIGSLILEAQVVLNNYLEPIQKKLIL